MTIGSFSDESLETIQEIFAQGQINEYLGKCDQKKLRERNKQPRTPLQEQADTARSQALTGKPQGGNRSESARKAAETRSRCKKGSSQPQSPTTTV